MSEENIRKASDIILALESKVETISKQVENIDNNIKLILNRLQSSTAVTKPVDNIPKEYSIKTSKIPGLREDVVLGPNGLQIKENIVSKNEIEVTKEDEDNFEFVQVNSNPNSSGRKVAVQQRITYSDGKNICLANVELKTPNGELVKKTRTNVMGKWIITLDPGNYIVNVVKSANKSNSGVEVSYPVQISESDRPVELPVFKV